MMKSVTHRGTRRSTAIGALALTGVMALSGCSVFNSGRAEREAEEAADRAGRIDMVLGEDRLEPDPEMIAVAVVLPEARELSSWPQTGGGETKVPGHVKAAEELGVDWKVNAGQGTGRFSALTAAPVTSETTIFVLDAGQTVRSFDIATGRAGWVFDLKSGSKRDKRVNGGGIAYDNGVVYAASGFGFVEAIDAETGRQVWRRDFDNPMVGSPTIRDGRLFVVSNNNEIFALDQETGATVWSDQAIAESARVLGSPSPAAVEDIVVVPFSSGEVITYLANNGRRLWSDALTRSGRFTPISAINDISARPVLGAGLVYAASQSGVFAAIDGRSGTRIWAQPIGSINAPALAGEFAFVVGVDGQVAAFQANTGQVIWTTQLEGFRNMKKRKGRISYFGPVVASGRLIVVSSEGEVVALSVQDGSEVERLDLKTEVFIEPIVAQGKLFVLSDDARLIAIR